MARGAVIGLDIGTFAVRAVELAPGGHRPVLNRFAQVALPPGAVVSGEVSDPGAVASALKRLWTEAGFTSKRVIVGVSGQRVIVRQAEIASMPDADLRSALKFEAQDLIPIPMDEALVDCAVLERDVEGGDDPKMRILLAAVPRDVVTSLLAAVDAAGLQAGSVDVQPVALLRALAGGDEVEAEAVVSVGAGVTTVAIREHGTPRFVRVLNIGGDTITSAIAEEVHCDVDYAEDLKRRSATVPAGGSGAASATVAHARQIVDDKINPLVEEIRGSLDFYLAQSDHDDIDHVVLTGGALRTPGLVERLRAGFGHDVEVADPLAHVEVGSTGLSKEQLDAAGPLLLAPLGLAMGGLSGSKGLALNLMPDEVAAARKQRQQVIAAGLGVLAFASILGAGWTVRQHQVSAADARAERAEAAASRLQGKIAGLAEVTNTQQALQMRSQQVRTMLADDVDYVRLLQQLAAVMPDDVWLTSFNAQKGSGQVPSKVSFAVSSVSQESVVRWVQQLKAVPALGDLWVPSISKTDGTNAVVTFQSTASLTPDARSSRVDRFVGGSK